MASPTRALPASREEPSSGAVGGPLRRSIGTVGLLFASVGGVIGSAWLFAPLYAAQIAGPGALLSWGIGAVACLLLALVFAELGTAFPVSGGLGRYLQFSHGSVAGFLSGLTCWLSYLVVAPLEAQAIVRYAADYLPVLVEAGNGQVLSTTGVVVATGLVAGLTALNLLGVRALADTNTVVTAWKILFPLAVAGVLLSVGFQRENLVASGGFLPAGWPGVFAGVSSGGVIFAYMGFRIAIDLAGESRNPSRAVPIALLGAVGISALVYLAVQLAFLGALRPGDLAHGWSGLASTTQAGPVAGLALALGLGWLATLLYVDSVISPSGSGLVFTASSARLAFAMGRNGHLPASITRADARGVPTRALALNFLLCLPLLLPLTTWQGLIDLFSSLITLSLGFGPIALLTLRRTLPDAPRPFRLRATVPLASMAFVIANLMVYWGGWDTNRVLLPTVLGACVVFAVTRRRAVAREWRSYAWIAPHLGGLTLLSWLGTFGGGRGVLPFGPDAVAVALLSLAVLAFAVSAPRSDPPGAAELAS